MRVFLTGATGFIGSHVARLLVREGCRVIALARPGSDHRRVADIKGEMEWISGDIFRTSYLKRALHKLKPELCIHLAWYAEPGDCLTSLRNIDYLSGSLDLLAILGESKCKRVVSIGTSIECDSKAQCATEETPLRPRNLYAAAKSALFMTGEQVCRRQGISFAWARIFNVYGPWEGERRLVPEVIRSLLAGRKCRLSAGKQVRDYLHVEDVARALWTIAQGRATGPVNIGSSEPVSVSSVARRLGRILGRPELLDFGKRRLHDGEPPILFADSTLLRSLGWKPRVSLDEGLAETVDWWRRAAQGSQGRRDHANGV